MDFSDPVQRRVFFEIHSGLPRESAGSDASTLRALDLVKDNLPGASIIADMACGPGSSVVPLAIALPQASLIAVDLHQPFIEETERRAKAQHLEGRVKTQLTNMLTPIVDEGSLDMIWCEGGIYNCGVETCLRSWRKYLKPDGVIVFNEPIWLVGLKERPIEAIEFWAGYPAMTDPDGIATIIEATGYENMGEFNLPEEDWWTSYYSVLEAKLDKLEHEYGDDRSASIPLEHTRHEIDIRRKFPLVYNYRFYAIRMIE